MRYVVLSLVFSAALLFSPVVYATAEPGNYYVDIHGGDAYLDNGAARLTAPSSGGSFHAHGNYDTGWLAGASAGYKWANGLSLEGEFTYRQNHIDRVAVGSSPAFFGGDAHSFAMMANGYYRLETGSPMTPYLGGGLGEAVIALNNLRAPGIGTTFGGTDATFAYQGIAGLAFKFTRALSVAVEYRYFGALRPGVKQDYAGISDLQLSPSYQANNGLLRVIYDFK